MSDNYQDFENTPDGHEALLTLFLKQIAFCMNPALAVVCTAGVAWAVWRVFESRDKREPLLVLGLVFLIVSYYATFLSLILFSYDRYILPIALLLAFPGGWLLGALAAPAGRWVAFRRLAVAGLFGYSLAYAASVDARLLADTRYDVEAYVRQHAPSPQAARSAVGIGRRKHIPRFRWIPWDKALARDGKILNRQRPVFVAINLTDMRHQKEIDFYQRMLRGEMGYSLVLLHRGKPLFDLLERSPMGTSSQRFINPEIALFQRMDSAPPPMTDSPVEFSTRSFR
jgi:hypothetical protein